MKVLFAHGMFSRPKTWELKLFKGLGFEPYALHVDYTRTSDKFNFFKKYIQENEIEFLVGHSHGGFMVYWLSEELGLPCLCINPQLSLSTNKHTKPQLSQRSCPLCLVLLGSDDRLVFAHRTQEFLRLDKASSSRTQIKVLNGIGHSIDPFSFEKALNWSIQEMKKQNLL